MLSIGKLGVGQQDYYLSRVASGIEDYYTGDGESPGRWVGAAAAQLGLHGQVQNDQLEAVLAGRHPSSGHQLSARAGSKRVPGWDLTFSAPKSVSVLYGLAERDESSEVVRAHEAAVAAGLEYLNRHAVVSRRRIDGEIHQLGTNGMVIAAFRHRTSRAGDPQLHTHCLVANLVEHGGGWGALHSPVIYKHGRTAGFVYQAVLRAELTERLGVAWRPIVKGVAEIDGIDGGLLRAFSKRRIEIEAHLDATGGSSRQAARVATLATRKAKEYGIQPEALTDRWWSEAESLGVRPSQLRRVLNHSAPVVGQQHLEVAVDEMAGTDGLTHKDATFERRDVVRAWCAALPGGSAVDLDSIEALTDLALQDTRLVQLTSGDPASPAQRISWSTQDMLQTEVRLLTATLARRDERTGVVDPRLAEQHLGRRSDLSDEQAAMVRHLTSSGQGVDVVVGRAGTGKTYALAAAVELWRADGYVPIGVALAARAAAELQAGTDVPSSTIARTLIDCDQATQPLLDERSVVIVDEAGMVDTRRLERLARHADSARAKLVLVGDHHQLPAVEAGGAFAALVDRLGSVELVENRRQVERWEQETLARLRDGASGRQGIADVIHTYDERGRVHVTDTVHEARLQMVADWHDARTRGEDVAMLALRRSDVRDLNTRARALLIADGTVSPEGQTWAGRTFAVGDDIVCLDNDRRVGLHNALFGRVVAADAPGLVIRTRTNRGVAVPDTYLAAGHVDHAYALTIHKAQGMTTDRTLLLGDDRLYRQGIYTGLSRGRDRNDVYLVTTDDRDDLEEMDAHGRVDSDTPNERLQRSLERDGSKSLAINEAERSYAPAPSSFDL